MIAVSTRLPVTGKKKEAQMRNSVFDTFIAQLWNLRDEKQGMLKLLQEIKAEHI